MQVQDKGKKDIVSYDGVHCANCATPMQGEFCHECGQSIHTVLKPMHHMMEDTLETFLHVDGRMLHTIPPLLTKPGFLTLEYFGGRRQRYIAPFRLMFVLCLLAFFITHIAIDSLSENGHSITPAAHVDEDEFEDQATPAAVQQALDAKLAELHEGRTKVAGIPGAATGFDEAEKELRKAASARVATLAAEAQATTGQQAPATSASASIPAAASTAPAAAASTATSHEESGANGRKKKDRHGKEKLKGWLNGHDPVQVAWLPGFMNARLNHAVDNLRENVKDWNSPDPQVRDRATERFKAGVFGALPQTMFVLMPAFALLLKLFYLFKRRLYMEHLIVALHSHAFLFAILLLCVALAMLNAWITPHAAWAGQVLGWLETALALWAPVYLLLMQKRVYRQGWILTVLKYLVIGWCYLWLFTIALTCAVALGISH
jgi:hypothetical protein